MILTPTQFQDFEPKRPTFALFGYPVSHSVSPQLHAALFAQSGVEADYIAVEVRPEELESALVLARKKLCGFNLTIPHKINILPLLDEIGQEAKALGSVNTVHFKKGKAYGYNTDIDGMSLSFAMDGISLKGKQALVLGNGGVSAMAAYLCAKQGAQVTVCARRPQSDAALRLKTRLIRSGYSVQLTDFLHTPHDAQIIINGTPVGMSPEEENSPLALTNCPEAEYIFDCIYNPRRTLLLVEAAQRGIPHQDGLLMLVGQAAKAQEIWLGTRFDKAQLGRTKEQLAAQLMFKRLHERHGKDNLVLCGFMGCGKTSVAKRTGELLGIKPLDTDLLVEQREGMPISAIFKEHGEDAFRSLERDAVQEAASRKGAIIALGGGAVLDPRNVETLRSTGLIVWLDTPIDRIVELLKGDQTRPLAQGGEAVLRARHASRVPIYENACNIRVSGITVEALCRELYESI